MVVFDYIFYRIAKRYYKKDGSDISMAVTLVSLIQAYIIALIYFIVLESFYTVEETAPYAKLVGKLTAIPGLILLFFNYRRYDNKYPVLEEYWRDKQTPLQRKILGILITLAVFAPFVALLIAMLSGVGEFTPIK